MVDASAKPTLPSWLWLWLPLAAAPVQVAVKALDEDVYLTWVRGERGIVENLTTLALVVAVVCAARLYLGRRHVASRWFGPFALVMAAGCFFFAGEEASWGQHWLGYEPPEAIAARNDQGEFNLHNDPVFEKLLDQLPRAILTLAALVGGVIVPLQRRRTAGDLRFDSTGPSGWIWPTLLCLPSAAMVLLVSLPKKVYAGLDRETPGLIDISPGETKELCLALFLMIYLLVLLRRLEARRGASAA